MKLFVAAQLLAIVLLQGYQLAPRLKALLHSEPSRACHGDHAQCGCSHERIAARSCCCFRVTLPCCPADGERGGEACIRNSPCGGDPAFTAASADNLKFLVPAFSFAPPQGAHPLEPGGANEAAADRHTKPPVPPPRSSFSA